MDSEPKYVNVSIADGARAIFHVAVKTRHTPGALGDIATRLGKAGINILSTTDCSSPDNPESTVSFFVEAREASTTEEDIDRVLESSSYRIDSRIRRSDSRLLVDDFAFPVMFYPGGRGVIFPQSGIRAMFDDIKKLFGSGGESILYQAGASLGREGVSELARLYEGEEDSKKARDIAMLYSALGWGRFQASVAEPGRCTYRLKLTEGFESLGAKSSRPGCHFTRGILAGSVEKLTGGPAECVETECASMGDPNCVFLVGPKTGPSTSDSS